jgi:hypothetical protein
MQEASGFATTLGLHKMSVTTKSPPPGLRSPFLTFPGAGAPGYKMSPLRG